MRKIFTTALAVIAAISMSAQTYKMEMRVWVDGTVEYSKDLSKVDSITFVKKIVEPTTQVVNPNFTPKPFSVSEDGKKVYFSQGNLQASTTDLGEHWTWSFATNQWDFVGNAAANNSITGDGKVSVNDTVDLFGWSTKETYYGINKSTDYSTYSGKFEDWGNNLSGGWYTLSANEWVYLFSTRTNASSKYGMATVAGVHGIIVLPDVYEGTAIDASNSAWDNNTINAEAWTAYEKAGAVFLPAAGSRNGTDVGSAGSYGCYWSASPGNEINAFYMDINSYRLDPQYLISRNYGLSVRLVQEVK